MKNIKKILKEKNIEEIIIWAPYDLYWKDLRQLDRTKKFVEKIKNIFPEISIKLEDERFTTFESLNILNMQWFSKKEISEKKDSMSAYLILESYLKRN